MKNKTPAKYAFHVENVIEGRHMGTFRAYTPMGAINAAFEAEGFECAKHAAQKRGITLGDLCAELSVVPASDRVNFRSLFGSDSAAWEFESAVLSIGREFLPRCALRVLDCGEASEEYWAWLCDQVARAEEVT